MKKFVLYTMMTLFGVFFAINSFGFGIRYKIATGNPRLTYYKIGKDLAKYVAAEADIDLSVMPTAGSVENVREMRYGPGVKFALVQSDVYQRYLDLSTKNPKASDLIKHLRVILPLYFEEVHFVVRKDSPMNFVHEIRDKRINIGAKGTGTAMTTTILYKMMFNEEISERNRMFFDFRDALKQLINKNVDVAVVVAGQPTGIFTAFSEEAKNIVKMLRIDPNNPVYEKAMNNYYVTNIKAESYKWLDRDIPCFAVKAFLITYNYPQKRNRFFIRKFAVSLGKNFDRLQREGHVKWKNVEKKLGPLPGKWKYYPVTYKAMCGPGLFQCGKQGPGNPGNTGEPCTSEMRILGLCD